MARRISLRNLSTSPARLRRRLFGMGCAKRGDANGGAHWQASRQSRPPEKPRPIRVAAKCGACFVALLGIVAQATTFRAPLALHRLLPATPLASDLSTASPTAY